VALRKDLKTLLSKELHLIEVYRSLSDKHPKLRSFLTSLLDDEQEHRRLIEAKIQELFSK
jgi:rubrerythrin